MCQCGQELLVRMVGWLIHDEARWKCSRANCCLSLLMRGRVFFGDDVFFLSGCGGLWKKTMCVSLSLYLTTTVLVLDLGLALTASVLDLGSGHV